MPFFKRPTYIDIAILSLFAVLITLHPHYMHGRINIFEVGLYLPGIQSVLDGQIPFRDFFHLRGPFELYIPALMMKTFGEHLTVLYSYFYFGTVLCLILCILIAREVFRTRFVLYLATLVLIGRTFPRVVFTYWGGMRYAWGLFAVWFAIKYFKSNKPGWLIAAGIGSMLGLLTSVEIGVYSVAGIVIALAASLALKVQNSRLVLKGFGAFAGGIGCVILPYGLYLLAHSALMPYIDSVLTVTFRMTKVIDPHLGLPYPDNFRGAFAAMVNPFHANFKQMTPGYLYIFVAGYLIDRIRRRKFTGIELSVLCLGVYGLIMYITGFRGIWTSQFEMALQPEKILMFFLLEHALLFLLAVKADLQEHKTVGISPFNTAKVSGIYFLIFAFFMSSVGYSIARYNHRFVAYQMALNMITGKGIDQLEPLANEEAGIIEVDRAKGIRAPLDQVREFAQVDEYVRNHVAENEPIFTYPQLGAYNFFFNRRPYGRFPIATFTWFKEDWHKQLMSDLNADKPRHIIMEKELPSYWEKIYLAKEPNRKKFDAVMDFIKSNYEVDQETALSYIYRLK